MSEKTILRIIEDEVDKAKVKAEDGEREAGRYEALTDLVRRVFRDM